MAAPKKTVSFDVPTTKEDSRDDESIALYTSKKQAAKGESPLYQIFEYPESAMVKKKKGVEEDPQKIWLGRPSRRPDVYPWCGEGYVKALEKSGCTDVVCFPRDPAKTSMHRRRRSPNLGLEVCLLFSGWGH
ncbi:hypothetical protein B0T14DRAFT_498471 [Immersiella caudata]|uniref:Uncharacterized protein n=1 Tax=Immersiella caudata TaxID=314043 RepID=A0AA39WLB9_9PEZI|nr:hypothetical protein B0T14DRAFT_498471 [Immersiella caudata]